MESADALVGVLILQWRYIQETSVYTYSYHSRQTLRTIIPVSYIVVNTHHQSLISFQNKIAETSQGMEAEQTLGERTRSLNGPSMLMDIMLSSLLYLMSYG